MWFAAGIVLGVILVIVTACAFMVWYFLRNPLVG